MTLVVASIKALGVILATCVIGGIVILWVSLLVEEHFKSAAAMAFAVAWAFITYYFYV